MLPGLFGFLQTSRLVNVRLWMGFERIVESKEEANQISVYARQPFHGAL